MSGLQTGRWHSFICAKSFISVALEARKHTRLLHLSMECRQTGRQPATAVISLLPLLTSSTLNTTCWLATQDTAEVTPQSHPLFDPDAGGARCQC